MKKDQVLILDCHGETRPAVCFSLEVAGYGMRVVTDEDEALNLLNKARLTDERYIGFLVNNPYLNIDISQLVEAVEQIDKDLPVLFVKDSVPLMKMVEALSIHCHSPIYHSEPTRVVDMLTKFKSEAGVTRPALSTPR